MRRLLAGLLVALFSLSVQAGVSTLWSVVSLSGRIQPSDYEELVRELDRRKPRVLLIHAVADGDEVTAAKIGEEIARRGLPLRVIRYCASPCAEHIFLRAPRRQMDPDAFVVFLPPVSAMLWAHVQMRDGEGRGSLISAGLQSRSREGLQALQALREQITSTEVSTRLLDFREQLLSGHVRTVLGEDTRHDEMSIDAQLPTRCRAWAPPASVLRALGVAVEAKRDARDDRFPHLGQIHAAVVHTGAPVPEAEQARLCPAG